MMKYQIHGVADCKFFSRKIDVKMVDQFIGFLADIEAHIGILITNKGYSKAARERAKNDPFHIYLEIVTLDELSSWKFDKLSVIVPFTLKALSEAEKSRNSEWTEIESTILRILDEFTPKFSEMLSKISTQAKNVIYAFCQAPYMKSVDTLANELQISKASVSAHLKRFLDQKYIEELDGKYKVMDPWFVIWFLVRESRGKFSIMQLMKQYLIHLAKESGYRDASYVSRILPQISQSMNKPDKYNENDTKLLL
ncbi:MAG: hypothetical protein GTO45_26975 [Candidatus Aminicenantes bacterium]|nr:hypothetical protein [Candidatus Aminicenantes bacterium]NIN21788.1 hypothetical protein [Candidatus Aminicenantes bacterium]NIN45580.1 hypothetical protein [Candidatus Aminicenantes bacterium]NIN88411.1 hypothetical protein [Candidatus Aminicenantes bacterium]NIO84830.1 hypothetical protein [Candidatus Aminicenantes bacterium]